MTYEVTISIPANEYERINRLLAIPSLEEMSDEELLAVGANTDYCEGIFCVDFPNGSSLTFDLCSGNENYFDDVVWTSKDGSLDVVLDCAYELDDIEFDAEGDTYIVQIVKEEPPDMIDIKLKDGQSGYDAVGKYIRRYWEHNIRDTVIVSIGTSYDGNNYELKKEVACPMNYDDIEFMFDWWEGERFIKLFGIKSVSEFDVSGGIYESVVL